jgi:hypothetical protein
MKPIQYILLFFIVPLVSQGASKTIQPSRTLEVACLEKLSLREFNGKMFPQRKQGGNPRKKGKILLFDGSMDGNRQVDPQIAVGGGVVFHATNAGMIIYDKTGKYIDGVRSAAFNKGIDPKVLYSIQNKTFLFDIWQYWDKEKKKPVNLSLSKTQDPTKGWNIYPISIPEGRDGGGLGCSSKWIGYTFPGGKDNTFVLRFADAKKGKKITVYFFHGHFGQPALTQGRGEELYFLKITPRKIKISRVRSNPDGTPYIEVLSEKENTLKYRNPARPAPQKGSDVPVAAGARNPKNLIYQGGDLWFSHIVKCNGRSAILWHQLGIDGHFKQTGIISSPSSYYIQPTLAVNRQKDLIIGFQETNEKMFVSPRFTFRLHTDPPGKTRKIISLGEGEGAIEKTTWGDYSGSVIDGDNYLDLWTIQSRANKKGRGETVIARIPFSKIKRVKEGK